THVRKLDETVVPEKVDAIVIDTSFISLTTVLPYAWPFLKKGGWCVALIKPQFEVETKYLDKGVVRDEEKRQWSVDKVTGFVTTELESAEIVDLDESPIKGPKGNVEFLLGLTRN
ncbi:MAG: SAM-dependent methyltransferase, partial [Mariprofundus sp.]